MPAHRHAPAAPPASPAPARRLPWARLSAQSMVEAAAEAEAEAEAWTSASASAEQRRAQQEAQLLPIVLRPRRRRRRRRRQRRVPSACAWEEVKAVAWRLHLPPSLLALLLLLLLPKLLPGPRAWALRPSVSASASTWVQPAPAVPARALAAIRDRGHIIWNAGSRMAALSSLGRGRQQRAAWRGLSTPCPAARRRPPSRSPPQQ